MRLSVRQMSGRISILILLAVIVSELSVAFAILQGQAILPVVLLVGLAGALAIYHRPALGAALILAFAPLEGFLQIQGHSFAKLITVLCIVVFLARTVIGQRGIKIDLTTVLMAAFALWSLASIVWSPNHVAFSKWVSFALQISLYFILINLVKSEEDLDLVLWGHILGGLVLAIILTESAVTQNFLRKGTVAGLGVNLVARMIGINVLLALLLYQSERRAIGRMLLASSMILSIIAVVVSLSRGAWIAVIFGITTFAFVYVANRYTRIRPANLVWLFVIGLASYYVLDTFILTEHGISKLATRFQDGITLNDKAGGRFDIWVVGWNMFVDSPLWGHGYESFANRFLIYAEQGSLAPQESKTAHNSFVGIIAQFGLVGIGLFGAILASVFYAVPRLLSESPTNVRALASVSALIVFLMMANLVDYAVDRKYLWYVLGIITLVAEYRKDDRPMHLLHRQDPS